MAHCHDMKMDEVYTCEDCGLRLKVVGECSDCEDESKECGCNSGCEIFCCGRAMKLEK